MRAVALGGGHGLVASLLAAHEVADEVTAIVGVADNGGSSGRLREFWQGCPALGDARLTISNLLGPESKLAQLLEYRFETGELAGHALGNLILFGLLEKTGALDLALDELAALGGLTTRVLPASNAPLVLQGMTITGEPLIGQLAVHWSPAVERVWVLPDVDPLPAVIEAIASADVVLLGPGSLYTSVLATALAPGIAKAINETQALVVFVANLAPQEAETRGYDLEHTIGALTAHGVVPDVVLVHAEDSPGPAVSMGESIRLVGSKLSENGVVHTPHLLAGALGRVVGDGKTLQP